jgi:hypothetical protein
VCGGIIHDEYRPPCVTQGRAASFQPRDEQITQPREKDGPILVYLRLRVNSHLLINTACQGEIIIGTLSGYNDEKLKEDPSAPIYPMIVRASPFVGPGKKHMICHVHLRHHKPFSNGRPTLGGPFRPYYRRNRRRPRQWLQRVARVHRNLLLRHLEPLLLHRHFFAQFEKGVSAKHVSDQYFVISFADIPDDIGNCAWAAVGISFGDGSKNICVFLGR